MAPRWKLKSSTRSMLQSTWRAFSTRLAERSTSSTKTLAVITKDTFRGHHSNENSADDYIIPTQYGATGVVPGLAHPRSSRKVLAYVWHIRRQVLGGRCRCCDGHDMHERLPHAGFVGGPTLAEWALVSIGPSGRGCSTRPRRTAGLKTAPCDPDGIQQYIIL